jgi:hypothetical protein
VTCVSRCELTSKRSSDPRSVPTRTYRRPLAPPLTATAEHVSHQRGTVDMAVDRLPGEKATSRESQAYACGQRNFLINAIYAHASRFSDRNTAGNSPASPATSQLQTAGR